MASECQTTRDLPLGKRQFAETESTLLANPLHRALTRFLFRHNLHFHIGKLVKLKKVSFKRNIFKR